MGTQIQFRRDTAVKWTSVNPILASGELGLEIDTDFFKFGDGVTPWNDLPYSGSSGGGSGTGVSGISGYSGYSGFGLSGYSGYSGTNGSGSSGGSGLSGYSGISGYSGYLGYSGFSGSNGYSGNSGFSGAGSSGFSGYSGSSVSGVGNVIPLGIPTSGSFSGIFPFTQTTFVTDAIEDINSLLSAISPAAPGILTGNLALSGITKYSAILPTGLNSSWYQNGMVAGNTITDYITDNTYTMASPNQSTSFAVGSTFGGNTGAIWHTINGVDTYFRNITSGVGTTNTIQITSIATYNTIWNKGNAQLNYTQVSEGFTQHLMKYIANGVTQQTNNINFWYDDVNSTPTFPSGLIVVAPHTTSSNRYLSGIRYFYLGDTFDFTASIANIANKSIRPVNPISYSMTGLTSVNLAIDGSSFAYNATYSLSQINIALNASNASTIDSRAVVIATKPSGINATSTSASQNMLVNTYSTTNSTNGNITMYDENYRFPLTTNFNVVPGSLTGNWNSITALSNGNGQLWNGQWFYPSLNYTSNYLPTQTVNYSTFSGDQVIVWGVNIGVAHSSMQIVFTGILYTDISADGTGNLNVDIILPSATSWLDAGKPFGSGNGCQIGASSGSTLNLSFGTYSSSSSNGIVFIKVTLKNGSAAKASQMVITGT